MELKDKVVIFGAGDYGRRAFNMYRNRVVCFIDNYQGDTGKNINGIPILSLETYEESKMNEKIIIAIKEFLPVVEQIKQRGITDYEIYWPQKEEINPFYPKTELIYNGYKYTIEAETEEKWNITNQQMDKTYYNLYVDDLYAKRSSSLFSAIEIETYNRCNGVCSFCPVNVRNDSRIEKKMDELLFKKIIDELEQLNYSGRLALFSNNEPFLDERIIEFHKYARKKVPKARMHLFTNGTLLTLEKFIEIIEYLDELIIDNYNQNLNLIPNVNKIKEYCEEHSELCAKVTIALRKPNEILTSRGGDAPNRKDKLSFPYDKCAYPFRQMIIRPDGKCSLCCNDPLGKNTLGDVSKMSLVDIWYGEEYTMVREALYKGRRNWEHCLYCDTFNY